MAAGLIAPTGKISTLRKSLVLVPAGTAMP
jgi:hypothetical protein